MNTQRLLDCFFFLLLHIVSLLHCFIPCYKMHRKHGNFHSKEASSIQCIFLYALADLDDFMCQAVEYCAYDN